MSNKDYSLEYLKNGFSVIPTRGKKPLILWQKYAQEKPTEQQVRYWWERWPDADIAAPTGAVSGIIVVDIDGGKIPSLPTTAISETSLGHYQYFFKHPGFSVQNSAKVVAPNIDIRGDGGFVVLPPSKHFNKDIGKQDYNYRWVHSPQETGFAGLPEWILQKIQQKKQVQTLVQGSFEGSRNNDAASLIGSLLVRYPQQEWESVCWPLIEAWNYKNTPPLLLGKLRTVFDSIKSREVLKNQRQSISHSANGSVVTQVGEENTGRLPLSSKPILLSELSIAEDPVEWIWEGYIAKGHLTLLSALWKAGKTTLITHFLKCIQNGKPLAGQTTKQCNVLVLSEESGTIWARRREEFELSLNVWLYSRPIKQKLSYNEWITLLKEMASFCRDNTIDLFIIDTLAGFWSVDNENDAARVSAALLPLNYLLEQHTAVLLVHHFRKSGGDEGTAARGSGALGAAVDIIVDFSRISGAEPNSSQRVLKAYSRFDETPKEIVIEFSDDEYITVGTTYDVGKQKNITDLLAILSDATEGLTVSQILEVWKNKSDKKPPAKREIQRYHEFRT